MLSRHQVSELASYDERADVKITSRMDTHGLYMYAVINVIRHEDNSTCYLTLERHLYYSFYGDTIRLAIHKFIAVVLITKSQSINSSVFKRIFDAHAKYAKTLLTFCVLPLWRYYCVFNWNRLTVPDSAPHPSKEDSLRFN